MKNLFTRVKAYLCRDVTAYNALRVSAQELQKADEELTQSTKDTESTIANQQAALSDVLVELLSGVKFLANAESNRGVSNHAEELRQRINDVAATAAKLSHWKAAPTQLAADTTLQK